MSEEKKWSNALNKPWYRYDNQSESFYDMQGKLISMGTTCDVLNETAELSIKNADKISEMSNLLVSLLEFATDCSVSHVESRYKYSAISRLKKHEAFIKQWKGEG